MLLTVWREPGEERAVRGEVGRESSRRASRRRVGYDSASVK
jgi:hypothetical protein